jgi:hypothetical protein
MILTPVNNRFLNHTNPIMTAAVTDGGSIQDREYIQRAARGIVDAGHWGNLKFWGCAGLAKLRNSGGVDYVPKLYDLSGNSNHATQTTTGYQPILSGGLSVLFDANDDLLVIGSGTKGFQSTNSITVMMYVKLIGKTNSTCLIGEHSGSSSTSNYGLWSINSGKFRWWPCESLAKNGLIDQAGTNNNDQWYYVCGTYDGTTSKLYIDGELSAERTSAFTIANNATLDLAIGRTSNSGTPAGFTLNGYENDIRIYNTALTGDQITAIYNQTSYRYA